VLNRKSVQNVICVERRFAPLDIGTPNVGRFGVPPGAAFFISGVFPFGEAVLITLAPQTDCGHAGEKPPGLSPYPNRTRGSGQGGVLLLRPAERWVWGDSRSAMGSRAQPINA
jgi:hypothetical protein